MKKKEYMEWVAKFGLGFFSWLKVLPLYGDNGKPVVLTNAVPIVHYPVSESSAIEKAVKAAGFHFAWSTVHCVAGYHIPKGHTTSALVKDN